MVGLLLGQEALGTDLPGGKEQEDARLKWVASRRRKARNHLSGHESPNSNVRHFGSPNKITPNYFALSSVLPPA